MFSTTTTVVMLVFLTSLSSSGDKSPTPEDLMPELKVCPSNYMFIFFSDLDEDWHGFS